MIGLGALMFRRLMDVDRRMFPNAMLRIEQNELDF
jgi:hypothetical protein